MNLFIWATGAGTVVILAGTVEQARKVYAGEVDVSPSPDRVWPLNGKARVLLATNRTAEELEAAAKPTPVKPAAKPAAAKRKR